MRPRANAPAGFDAGDAAGRPGTASDVDFGRRSEDYAEHRPGFPETFYQRLERVVSLDGARVLDAGSGPGVLSTEVARRGATVIGFDVAANQIRAAVQRAGASGLAGCCAFCVARAEQIPLADAQFDLAIAGQCWHWFDAAVAMAELRRVLRPGGFLAVAYDCYLAPDDELARATEALILRFNPGWTMAGATGLFPELIDELTAGGFDLVEQFTFDHDHVFTHVGWRGRIRTCNGVGSGALSDDDVAAFDLALAELMRERFPDERLRVRHRVWATVVRRPLP